MSGEVEVVIPTIEEGQVAEKPKPESRKGMSQRAKAAAAGVKKRTEKKRRRASDRKSLQSISGRISPEDILAACDRDDSLYG